MPETDVFSVQHSINNGIERVTYTPKHRRFETPILMQHGMWHGAWCWQQSCNLTEIRHEMSFLVLSYPGVSPDDDAWIQNLRARHDQLQYDIVGPHFTFVFPVSGLDQNTFVTHVKNQAQGLAQFTFALRCAVVVKDALNAYTHVCLTPDEGYSAMVKLHDRLYTGPLAAELRLDIPFIPHLTVGYDADAHACKRLADDLNAQGVSIPGAITALDVVRYEGRQVESIERIALI